jgi:NAD+ kinase
MRLGIIANTGKARVPEVLNTFLAWLASQKIPFLISAEIAPLLKSKSLPAAPTDAIGDHVDYVLSFGGDGTFLQTARAIAPSETPIIGVNLGGFGYLAEVGVEQLKESINALQAGRFSIQERVMLSAEAQGSDVRYYGLNDIVIDKGGFARTIRLDTSIDGEFLNTFTADGLIVATPTGSTGYSLSAGGPILEPRLNGIIINPICPHMLANRPLVVCGDRTISITAQSELGTFQFAVDGQQLMELPSGSRVTICRAPFKTRIVQFRDFSFFSLLRTKLQWRNQLEP